MWVMLHIPASGCRHYTDRQEEQDYYQVSKNVNNAGFEISTNESALQKEMHSRRFLENNVFWWMTLEVTIFPL